MYSAAHLEALESSCCVDSTDHQVVTAAVEGEPLTAFSLSQLDAAWSALRACRSRQCRWHAGLSEARAVVARRIDELEAELEAVTP